MRRGRSRPHARRLRRGPPPRAAAPGGRATASRPWLGACGSPSAAPPTRARSFTTPSPRPGLASGRRGRRPQPARRPPVPPSEPGAVERGGPPPRSRPRGGSGRGRPPAEGTTPGFFSGRGRRGGAGFRAAAGQCRSRAGRPCGLDGRDHPHPTLVREEPQRASSRRSGAAPRCCAAPSRRTRLWTTSALRRELSSMTAQRDCAEPSAVASPSRSLDGAVPAVLCRQRRTIRPTVLAAEPSVCQPPAHRRALHFGVSARRMAAAGRTGRAAKRSRWEPPRARATGWSGQPRIRLRGALTETQSLQARSRQAYPARGYTTC